MGAGALTPLGIPAARHWRLPDVAQGLMVKRSGGVAEALRQCGLITEGAGRCPSDFLVVTLNCSCEPPQRPGKVFLLFLPPRPKAPSQFSLSWLVEREYATLLSRDVNTCFVSHSLQA